MSATMSAASESVRLKHEWFQTGQDVVVSVLLRDAQPDRVSVAIESTQLTVTAPLGSQPDAAPATLNLQLCHPIDPQLSTHRFLKSRVEVRMRKADGHQWTRLEGDGRAPSLRYTSDAMTAAMAAGETEGAVSAPTTTSTTATSSSGGGGGGRPPAYPSSARMARDWDRIASDLRRQEENEKPEGEEALNQLFQKIFADGSDDVKRAMNKSFTESGGTVLSTNWKDIGAKKTEVKPPDGMEYKKWDQ